jgi:hypothetical protein
MTYQEHNRALSFGTDAWTSPNYKVYMAITVHFEQNGDDANRSVNPMTIVRSRQVREGLG